MLRGEWNLSKVVSRGPRRIGLVGARMLMGLTVSIPFSPQANRKPGEKQVTMIAQKTMDAKHAKQ